MCNYLMVPGISIITVCMSSATWEPVDMQHMNDASQAWGMLSE